MKLLNEVDIIKGSSAIGFMFSLIGAIWFFGGLTFLFGLLGLLFIIIFFKYRKLKKDVVLVKVRGINGKKKKPFNISFKR